MVDLRRLSVAQKAVLLLRKGLSPRSSALRGDPDYAQLLAHWHADPEFRVLVEDLALMLDLRVVDVLEHAIVLAPLGAESVFAAKLTDLRSGLGEMQRGALALIQIAIAATFFPTASVLTGARDDHAEVSATPLRVTTVLREHCQRLEAEASDDTDLEEAGLVEAWRELARMPDTKPDGSQRAALGSLAGMVKLVLNHLLEHGMVQTINTAEGETYLPTPRYRLQVRELAANELFERCVAVLPSYLDDGGR